MKKRPEYDLKKMGEQIRKLRRERGISVEQIREYMQFCSSQAIYKWEKGMCFPQADNLMALAKLFDVNPNDIMVEKNTYDASEFFEMIRCFMQLKRKQHIVYSIEPAVGFMYEQNKI